MSEREPLLLHDINNLQPVQLIEAAKRMPLTADGFVPINLFSIVFEVQTPTIKSLGQDAVKLSFDRPFGFIGCSSGPSGRARTQQTDGLVLAPSDTEPNAWAVILSTDRPLSNDDRNLFRSGLTLYARDARTKLQTIPLRRSLRSRLFRR